MFAVRALRHATGAEVGDKKFSHTEWTLLKSLPDEVKGASEPKTGQTHPVLQVIEVKNAKDPALAPFPVLAAGDDAELPAGGTNPALTGGVDSAAIAQIEGSVIQGEAAKALAREATVSQNVQDNANKVLAATLDPNGEKAAESEKAQSSDKGK